MILLVASAVVITAVAIWYLVRSLHGAGLGAGEERYQQLQQLKDRLLGQLNELDLETADRNIDAGVVVQERGRLEVELARVLNEIESLAASSAPAAPANRHRRGEWRVTVAVVALLLPIITVTLYVTRHYATLTTAAAPATAGRFPPEVMQMVARLERRLSQEPQDPEGWARLGRAYQVLERFDESREAYATAHRLAPDDPAILAEYAALTLGEDPRNPAPETVNLFRKLHKLDPHHPSALWTLGLAAFNQDDFKAAAKYWESLLKELPPDSEVGPQIRKAIAAARAKS